jgi:hypothetical protein
VELIKSKKSKTGKGLTYSIGLKQISELLSEVEIYEKLNIWFNKNEGGGMGLFIPGDNTLNYLKGSSKELLRFNILISGNYSTPLDKWIIIIHAVKAENNKLIKEFLIEIGIPLLRNWFESEKSETWFSGHRYFQIGLNKSLTEYCVLETQNDRIIKKKINNCA